MTKGTLCLLPLVAGLIGIGGASGCAASSGDADAVSATSADLDEQLPRGCASPPPASCDFYASCLEASHPCGAGGYALGFGDRYCTQFLAKTEAFSPAGQAWSESVRHCLQLRLGRFLETPATCDAIRTGAYADHASCYTQPEHSICDLPFSDWLLVVNTIDPQDQLSHEGLEQISEVSQLCVSGWLSSIVNLPSVAPGDREDVLRKLALAARLRRDYGR